MDNVTKKIINNFREGLITELGMVSQLYEADSNGNNYDLRCESLGESYYQCYGYNPCTGECKWED